MSFIRISLPLAMLLILPGCFTPPTYTSATRPEVKIIPYSDLLRRALVQSRTHLYTNERPAICVRGFAGRVVTLELWEEQKGRVQTWNHSFPAPRAENRVVATAYADVLGSGRMTAIRGDVLIESEWVLDLLQLPPGNYQVRVTSHQGIQLQQSFVLSK